MRSYTLHQGYDKYTNAPFVHFTTLHLALSRYAPFLCRIFEPSNKPPLSPPETGGSPHRGRGWINRSPAHSSPLPTHLTCRQSSVRFCAKLHITNPPMPMICLEQFFATTPGIPIPICRMPYLSLCTIIDKPMRRK